MAKYEIIAEGTDGKEYGKSTTTDWDERNSVVRSFKNLPNVKNVRVNGKIVNR